MFALCLTAELTGVTDLRPSDSEENPFYYMFKVTCTSCREQHGNWVGVNRFYKCEISGSRGEANLVWRCKNCKVFAPWVPVLREQLADNAKRESSAVIKTAPKSYPHQEVPKRQNIIEFECRGCEFVRFKSEGDWEAVGLESNTRFDEIDLTDKEWFDYDEKTGNEVSIKDVKWEIKRA